MERQTVVKTHPENQGENLESLCANCGVCCRQKIDIGGYIIVDPSRGCKNLGFNAEKDAFFCKIYAQRFIKTNRCMSAKSAAEKGLAPPDCPYTLVYPCLEENPKPLIICQTEKKLREKLRKLGRAAGDEGSLLSVYHSMANQIPSKDYTNLSQLREIR